jgi:hypothetical protein
MEAIVAFCFGMLVATTLFFTFFKITTGGDDY